MTHLDAGAAAGALVVVRVRGLEQLGGDDESVRLPVVEHLEEGEGGELGPGRLVRHLVGLERLAGLRVDLGPGAGVLALDRHHVLDGVLGRDVLGDLLAGARAVEELAVDLRNEGEVRFHYLLGRMDKIAERFFVPRNSISFRNKEFGGTSRSVNPIFCLSKHC